MQISTRFTEYGLTGAFFWLSQAALISLYADVDWSNLHQTDGFNAVVKLVEALPGPLQGSIAALVGTVGVIAIFVAGVMLELLPSVFTFPQMVAFRNTARQNESWLHRWAETCGEPARTDLRRLLDEVPGRYFSFQWQAIKSLRHYARWQRLQATLFACVESRGKSDGDLSDQLHLWRTSRVIGNVMLLMALEVLFIYGEQAWVLLAHFALYLGAFMVTLLSYHRLCYALFSHVCMLQHDAKGA